MAALGFNLTQIFQKKHIKKTFGLGLVLFVFIGIPLTVFVTITTKDTRVKAEAPILNTTYPMGVLVINFFPSVDGIHLSREETSYPEPWFPEKTLVEMRTKISDLTSQRIAQMESGSKYHGYKDSTATPSLDYFVVQTNEYNIRPPISIYGQNATSRYIDHRPFLYDLNICDLVENRGVKEVWVWTYHNQNVTPVESFMSGPLASIGNGGSTYNYPVCGKSFTTYDYNYINENVLHNHGHQFEIVLKRVGDPLFENQFIGPFKTYSNDDGSAVAHRCGWTHTPPNTSGNYDYVNQRFSWTDCEDWKPDGSGAKVNVNCDKWKCDGNEFQIWRWQNMPGKNNNVFYNGIKMRNWWDWIGDYDKAARYGNNLTVQDASVDSTAPSVPTGLKLTYLNDDKVTIEFDSVSESGSGWAGIVIKKDGKNIWRPGGYRYFDDLLPGAGNHTYQVAAYDKWINVSGFSTSITVVVPATKDIAPPSIPTNLRLGTNVTFTWDPSIDDKTGIKAYRVYRNAGYFYDVTTVGFKDTTYQPGLGIFYEILAVDYAGNMSAKSVKFYPDQIQKQGDVNDDGSVNAQDLSILLSTWNSTTDLRADLNGDGKVTAGDLARLISSWGT